MIDKLRRCEPIAAAGLLAITLASGAAAMPACEGTYSALSMRPLPAHIVVGLDIHDRSPEHLRLAERFLAGIRKAGVAVSPRPNVLLHISSSRLEESPDRSGGPAERQYPELSGIQGGIHLGLPAIPNTRLAAPSLPPTPPLLSLRVDATEGQATRISWAATVQCRMVGTDDGERAEELGRVIGGALGRRIDPGPV